MCQCTLITMMRMSLPAQMQNKPTIVIAAISSRPYVKAATEAGFDVIAMDAYVDLDTQAMAKQCIQIDCKQNQFNAEVLLAALNTLSHQKVLGFTYGAGFEAQPELIEKIQSLMPVFGNLASTIKHCKDPVLFAQFCQDNCFTTPRIALDKPSDLEGWLIKAAGGSGGVHVHIAKDYLLPLASNQYFQRSQSGLSISCLFNAADDGAHIVGVNEQWVAADALVPFQYGGAVSHCELTPEILAEFTRFITLAKQHFQLRGLNSVDALLDGNQLVFLEINPRLSATIDLYAADEGSLFAAHISAFQSHSIPTLHISNQSKAHHIVYAKQIMHIQAEHAWPEWVCDIPNKSQTFEIGMPVCTVISVAEYASVAKQLVQARVASLKQ
jgi:predicted ATP-grasp superfamily ATP-dependent carboligase